MFNTNQRSDCHRPSAIIPADYTHELEYGRDWVSYDCDEGKDEEWSNMTEAVDLYAHDGAFVHGQTNNIEKAVLQCDVCGARFKYGSLFRHNFTQQLITMGHDCALKMNFAYDQVAAEAIHGRMERTRRIVIERRNRWVGLMGWVRQQSAELLAALDVDHHIIKDIRSKLVARGAEWGLTERQAAFVLKLAAEASQPAEKHVPVPVDGERIQVVGTVLGLKVIDGDYGSCTKMTVKVETPEGSWLVYGTAPSVLFDLVCTKGEQVREAYWDNIARNEGESDDDYTERVDREKPAKVELKGQQVEFTARVVKGNREEFFGFYSRPTKAALVG